jgi:vancomycin resistance protein VanW
MQNHMNQYKNSVQRSVMRARVGMLFYGLKRRFFWIAWKKNFAKDFSEPLSYCRFSHRTPLFRKLNQVEMQYQHNKIVNLKLAAKKMNGIVVHPGEIFSYWNLIGNPTKRKGYLMGIVLQNGQVGYGTGGGLCQLSNLIYWMTLHTPLTDADRTQPFGSGATCCYPHIDLMIQNNTTQDFQLILRIEDENLQGEWRTEMSSATKYKIIEKNHKIIAEYWGGYTRRNQLYRQVLDLDGSLIHEEFVVSNDATMMYEPFLSE